MQKLRYPAEIFKSSGSHSGSFRKWCMQRAKNRSPSVQECLHGDTSIRVSILLSSVPHEVGFGIAIWLQNRVARKHGYENLYCGIRSWACFLLTFPCNPFRARTGGRSDYGEALSEFDGFQICKGAGLYGGLQVPFSKTSGFCLLTGLLRDLPSDS